MCLWERIYLSCSDSLPKTAWDCLRWNQVWGTQSASPTCPHLSPHCCQRGKSAGLGSWYQKYSAKGWLCLNRHVGGGVLFEAQILSHTHTQNRKRSSSQWWSRSIQVSHMDGRDPRSRATVGAAIRSRVNASHALQYRMGAAQTETSSLPSTH